MPRSPDALVDEAIRCPCTAGGKPWCVRCECLIQLALARDVWMYEQVTGLAWWTVMVTKQEKERLMYHERQRLYGWRGLGYLLLGWACEAWAYAVYFAWILPRMLWLRSTGQIPRSPFAARLPIRMRERAWCTVCEQVLAEGAVRCPVHPEGEVMLVLREEGSDDAAGR